MAENKEGKGSKSVSKSTSRSPNDQKSDAFNPTSSENKAAMDNRSNQMNPNNPAHHHSKGKGK